VKIEPENTSRKNALKMDIDFVLVVSMENFINSKTIDGAVSGVNIPFITTVRLIFE